MDLTTESEPAQRQGCCANLLNARREFAAVQLLPVETPALDRLSKLIEIMELRPK